MISFRVAIHSILYIYDLPIRFFCASGRSIYLPMLSEDHNDFSNNSCPCNPNNGQYAPLFQDLLPGLHKRDFLCAGDYPEITVTDPETVNHDPVVPIHHFEEEESLQIRRPEVMYPVPDTDNQDQGCCHDRKKGNHKSFSLLCNRFRLYKAKRKDLLPDWLRVEIQAVQCVVSHPDFYHQCE